MKRISLFLLIFFLLAPMTTGYAQNTATTIDSLVIDLWPDYDRASVLVLLTGTLPSDTKLPATVILPIPETAQLNAVARIDSKEGQMKDDIFSSRGPSGTLKLITPDLRFRVEYYFPYTTNNHQRSFDYTWIAKLSVDKLQLKVQQPLSAGALNTTPATGNIVKAGDGFDYHIYPSRSAPAGQPFSVRVEYKMDGANLSIESLPQQKTGPQTTEMPDRSSTTSGFSWPIAAIVVGGLVIIISLVWRIVSRRPLSAARKPVPKQAANRSRARFCRTCGKAVDGEDNFCRGCGQDL